MRTIDSIEEFLNERTYDDINPELEGHRAANPDRYRLLRWADKEMAAKIESILMED